MKLPRRKFLHLAAGAAALPAVSRIAWAQAYPSRPVRIDRRLSAGRRHRHRRAPDRSMAVGAARPAIHHREPAGRRQQYRHRGGRARAAGRLYAPSGQLPTNAINATLYDKLNFNFIRDIAPVAGIIRAPHRHGGQSIGSGQDGSRVHRLCQGQSGQDQHGVARQRDVPHHVAGELFKMMTGVDMVHVPYRGAAPALTDLLGGQVQVMFGSMTVVDRVHQGRQAARAGSDHRDALGGAAGHPDRGRFRAGLRGERLVRASARPRTRPPRSSTSSTRRSMPASPIPR